MGEEIAALERVRELLDRLERSRERLAEVEGDGAVDVLRELSELARDVQTEIERARRAGPGGTGEDAPA